MRCKKKKIRGKEISKQQQQKKWKTDWKKNEQGKTEETNDSSFSDLFPSLNISPSSENRIFLSSEQIPPVIRDFIPKQSPLATGMRPAQLFEDPLVKKQKELELEAVNKSKIDYRFCFNYCFFTFFSSIFFSLSFGSFYF